MNVVDILKQGRSTTRTRVILKPEQIVPDFDLVTSK